MSTGTRPRSRPLDFSFRVNHKTRDVIISNLCRRLNLLQSITALIARLEDPVRSDEQGRFDVSTRCSLFASCRDSTGARLTLAVSSRICIAPSYDFNQSGSEIHMLSVKIAGNVPRDAMSAGLSSLEQ